MSVDMTAAAIFSVEWVHPVYSVSVSPAPSEMTQTVSSGNKEKLLIFMLLNGCIISSTRALMHAAVASLLTTFTYFYIHSTLTACTQGKSG